MKIAIIGGGFTGLSAAFELAKSGHDISLYEKENHFGGLVKGFKKPDWEWPLETFYHHVFTGDRDILKLVCELEIGNRIIKLRPVTVTQSGDSFFPLDSPLSLLGFPGLTLTDKLQTGLLIAAMKINPFWKPLENFSADQVFRKFGGDNAWKILWEPLLNGKFSEYASEVSASWLWARLKKRSSSLIYFQGGFQSVIDRLIQKLQSHKVKLFPKTSVKSIRTAETGIAVVIDGKSDRFDRVLFTGPTGILAQMAPELPDAYVKPLLSIPHLHAQILILETKQPILQSAYWLNVADRSFPFLALVQHTNFIDKKHYGGKHLAYIGNYLPENHPFLKKSAHELFEIYLPYLKKLNPTFNHIPLTTYHPQLFTAPHAQPVHFRHYSKIAPKFQTPLPNLFLANMDSIYPWDRGTNYAVKLGKDAAEFIRSK